MQHRTRHLVALIASFIVLASIASYGQLLKGYISGAVTDPEGAVISGAQVRATNVATGTVLTTTTDNSRAVPLQPDTCGRVQNRHLGAKV